MKEKTVFWKELPPRKVVIEKISADSTILSLPLIARVSVCASPLGGFLIKDYGNRIKIGEDIYEEIKVKYGERSGATPEGFEYYAGDKQWKAKLKRGWFQDYLEVHPSGEVNDGEIVVFRCVPPVELDLGFNRYFYCGWLPISLAILGGIGYRLYKKVGKTKKE